MYGFALSGVVDVDAKLRHYKRLLLELPPVNYCTLKRLILHLTQYVYSLHYRHSCISGY